VTGEEQREVLDRAVVRVYFRTTHGKTGTSEYKAWDGMKQRCFNPNDKSYPNYGGRGIRVCARWLGPNGFVHFLADVGPRPSSRHSIDRINNDGNYAPGNCRWATPIEQQSNRRNNVHVRVGDVTRTAAAWGRRLGAERHRVLARIAWGWSAEDAATRPRRPRETRLTVDGVTRLYVEWAAQTGIPASVITCRIRRGWPPADAVSIPVVQAKRWGKWTRSRHL